jgi:DNA replication initiation complex subunit (GINS family)
VREVEAEIEEALKAERTSQELAKLPEDFYTRISHFLATLEKKEAEGLEKEELEEKKKVIAKMVEELLELRIRKALALLPKRLPENLLACERPYFEGIAESLRKMRASLLSIQSKEPTTELLIINEKIPRIVAEDLKFYGPFSKGDVASLPKRTAEILVNKGLAKRVQMNI